MRIQIYILAALLAAGGAIISQPLGCSHPASCAPRVIANCPNKNPIASCRNCCCDATENVEFYNPYRPEPRCIAPPAVFSVKFVSTWSRVCHPDYYFSTAHWSPPTGASHNTAYQMWDACMDNVSPGVAEVSQTGATRLIEEEYEAAGDNILDTFKSDRIDGVGETSRDLDVDKDHQWVSAAAMLAPSLDRMVGVANLRLCDGHDWKRRVKVCFELFSTATWSERFHDPMERNSIQWNNCSFGYFEFTFKNYQDHDQLPPKNCEFESHRVCPPSKDIPQQCRACCCLSSDNVEFYSPNASSATCGANTSATYKLVLKNHYNPKCHPNYTVPAGLDENQFPYYTTPLVISHRPTRVRDRCNLHSSTLSYIENIDKNPDQIIGSLLNASLPSTIRYAVPDPQTVLRYRFKRRVMYFNATAATAHVTVISKLLPSASTFVGVSGLSLCDGNGWKERIEVCEELFSAFNSTMAPDGDLVVQGNQCSFATLIFELKSTTSPEKRRREVLDQPVATCTPLNGSVDVPLKACCFFEYIIEGKVIRQYLRHTDPKYRHTLLVSVETVYYDEINHIHVGDIVEIKICSLLDRIKWNNIYQMMGARECGSNELVISERGVFADTPRFSLCAPYILGGGCDDPR